MKIKDIMKNNSKILEFARFVIVGGGATAIHYLIYFFLQVVNVQYNLAYTLGYGISFIFNFIASNYFTFKTKPTVNRGVRFAAAHFINYLLQISLLNIFIYLQIPKNIAPIFVFAIAIPINFIMVKISLKKGFKI